MDGVALLLPLPTHIRQRIVTEALPPEKDRGRAGAGQRRRLMLGFPSFVPSTADAALELLRSADLSILGECGRHGTQQRRWEARRAALLA